MKTTSCWLLYDDQDYEVNRDFAAFLAQEGVGRGFSIRPVLLSQLTIGMEGARPFARVFNDTALPDLVLSRQREPFFSRHFEAMGIPVFNNAKACEICNDKRATHRFLQGLPMLNSVFLSAAQAQAAVPPRGTVYPALVKPACSHGGDRVEWVETDAEWRGAVRRIAPDVCLQQNAASTPGMDVRVYVVFGEIIAAVCRRAKNGFLSNYKQGGQVSLHTLSKEERALAHLVIQRFGEAGAPLSFAGIDFLYHQDHPVVSEVEDVVGSRMLYQVSDLNIVGIFLDALRQKVKK